MALNFAQFISQNTPNLTPAQRTALLDKVVYSSGYTDTVADANGNQIPNPVSKTVYFNRLIGHFLRSRAESYDSNIAATQAGDTAAAATRAIYQQELEG